MMKTTAEMKIEISNARITNAIVMHDGTCKLEIELDNENANDECILVEASKLSLKDAFMNHNPKTQMEALFKNTLTEVIKTGIDDFYRPTMDPSFADKQMTKIHYMSGEEPAIGPSYHWWKKAIKDSKWCFGTKAQYVAFLGVLIKMLMAKGWSVDEAWDAVCNNSKKLGHYEDSDNAKQQFEDTGSREIVGFFDLANTYKILAEDEERGGFWWAGGDYRDKGYEYSLAVLGHSIDYSSSNFMGIAWLVLKK